MVRTYLFIAMIKKLLLAIALLLPLSLHAQILYKVSGKNLKQDSYIFGTHHLTPFSFTEEVEGFSEALKNCDKVYGEIKLDPQTTAQMTQKMMPMIMMPQDTLFRDLVTEEEYIYIDSQIKKYLGAMASLDQMSMLKPATISMQLTAMVAMQDENGQMQPPVEAMDFTVQNKATELGKEIGGLETIESQLALLYGESLKDQAQSLITSLKSGDMRTENKKLTALYEAQDSKALFQYIAKSLASTTKTKEDADNALNKLLFNRNQAWAEALPEIMQSGSTLVVVGAGHLQGEKGLVNLLRSKGYTLTPMK